MSTCFCTIETQTMLNCNMSLLKCDLGDVSQNNYFDDNGAILIFNNKLIGSELEIQSDWEELNEDDIAENRQEFNSATMGPFINEISSLDSSSSCDSIQPLDENNSNSFDEPLLNIIQIYIGELTIENMELKQKK
eukprot:1003869_1